MARLEIRLLGEFQVVLDGEPITTFESSKVRALLALLSAEPKRSQRRETLATLLWEDWPRQSGMSNLRYALSDLRQNLGDRKVDPPFLLITRDRLQLNSKSDIWIDGMAFVQQINLGQEPGSAQSALRRAVELYQGPFLEGFSLGDSSLFEDWLGVQREQYQRQMLQALLRLTQDSIERREYEQGLGYAYRQVEIEPWLEEAHQQIMRLLSLSGRRSEALAYYEKCRQLMTHELGVDLSIDTHVLYEHIRDQAVDVCPSLQMDDSTGVRRSTPNGKVISFPTPVPPSSIIKNNLPVPVSRFLGREIEIKSIRQLLTERRLVTLTGSGGVGKTRLGLQVAEAELQKYLAGVWFINLAPLSDPDVVEQEVANILGVRQKSGESLVDSLTLFIRERKMLILLDNCEHLLGACARLAESLLRGCSELRIQASSREPLGISGEAVFVVPSLPFPAPDHLPPIEQMMNYTAVALFVERARDRLSDYQVTEENAPFIAQICARLDGIPLALELAAARLRLLDTETLASRLKDSFHLLANGSQVALARHQTLRATLDWSYSLIGEAEQRLLQRLSVFSGGCSLQAAETVCAEEEQANDDVINRLGILVDTSLVIADRQTGAPIRYRLLEMVRQYAGEKLDESGDREQITRRHRDFFLHFAETNVPNVYYKERPFWISQFKAEVENIRNALEWSFRHPKETEAGVRLVIAMCSCWACHNTFAGIQWTKRGIDLLQRGVIISPSLRSLLLGWASYYLKNEDLAEQSLALSRNLGSDEKETLCLSIWFVILRVSDKQTNYDQTLTLLEEHESIIQDFGSRFRVDARIYQADNANLRTTLERVNDHFDEAKIYASKSISLIKECAHDRELIYPYRELGLIAYELGDYRQAKTYFSEAYQLSVSNEDTRKGLFLAFLCEIERREGNLRQAFEYCKDFIRLAYEKETPFYALERIEMAAEIIAKKGRFQEAARLSGAAEALSIKINRQISTELRSISWPTDLIYDFIRYADVALDVLVPDWRSRPDGEMILAAWNEGQGMGYDQAVQYALCETIE